MSRKSADKPLATPDLRSTIFYLPADARVVEWQTRTFEGRMPKGMRVQVPPRAPYPRTLIGNRREMLDVRKAG